MGRELWYVDSDGRPHYRETSAIVVTLTEEQAEAIVKRNTDERLRGRAASLRDCTGPEYQAVADRIASEEWARVQPRVR